jgi:hypothetical protein
VALLEIESGALIATPESKPPPFGVVRDRAIHVALIAIRARATIVGGRHVWIELYSFGVIRDCAIVFPFEDTSVPAIGKRDSKFFWSSLPSRFTSEQPGITKSDEIFSSVDSHHSTGCGGSLMSAFAGWAAHNMPKPSSTKKPTSTRTAMAVG